MACDFDVMKFIKKLKESGLDLTSKKILRKFAADEAVLYYVEHKKEFSRICKTEVQKQSFIKMLEGKILRAAAPHLMKGKKK